MTTRLWGIMVATGLVAVGVAVTAGAAMAAGAAGAAETLEQALASTYTTNPTLLAQRARLRAADENVSQALAGWRPTVRVSTQASRQSVTTPGIPTAYYSPQSIDVSLSQPLFSGGRTVAQTEQADKSVLAERALLIATEENILQQAADAYLNVVRDQSVVQLRVDSEQVLRRQLEATQKRYRIGELTATDVSQAEARLAQTIALRVQAEGLLQGSRATYEDAVGHAPETLAPPTLLAALPTSRDEVLALAEGANPSIVQARHTAEAGAAQVDVYVADLLPQLSLQADAVRSYNTTSSGTAQPGTRTDTLQATLNLSVPFYQGGAEYSRVRQQKHTANQQRITIQQARRTVLDTAATYWEALVSARDQIASLTKQVESDASALDGVQKEAQVGSRSVLDVLNAEQELVAARVSLVLAQHDELNAAYQVAAAIGRMTAEGLHLPVTPYDPTVNYDRARDAWVGLSGEED